MMKIFVQIDHIYQKTFVSSVSVFCSQICILKLNLRPKVGLTLCNVYRKVIFFFLFCLKFFFYFSLLNVKSI